MNVTRLIVQSKARGVSVDREKLAAYVVQVEAEIKEIEQKFCNALAGPIEEVQRLKLEEAKAKYKTEKGRAGAKVDDFNPGSNKQLTTLFVTVMKQPVQFTSATGQPSFKKAHLHTWGDGGEILLARRQRMLVLKQAQNLLKLSEEDGRWHVGLKTVGTSSGRFAGGS
jgi:DNA polymerase I-like protein with 3'-5' exonuclease and polymerase domains